MQTYWIRTPMDIQLLFKDGHIELLLAEHVRKVPEDIQVRSVNGEDVDVEVWTEPEEGMKES